MMQTPLDTRIPAARRLRFFVVLFTGTFVLNWFWEMLQMRAYSGLETISWREAAPGCTMAALGDVGISVVLYGIGALAAGRLLWAAKNSWNVYCALALLALCYAALTERYALASHRWSYNHTMPIVPLLNIGLWPLLQLMVLVPLTTRISVFWLPRSKAR